MDRFEDFRDSPAHPSRCPFSVIPHDTAPLPLIPKGLYIGMGGDVTLRGVDGKEDVVYRNLPDASYIAVRALHVRASGTTATAIVGEA